MCVTFVAADIEQGVYYILSGQNESCEKAEFKLEIPMSCSVFVLCNTLVFE